MLTHNDNLMTAGVPPRHFDDAYFDSGPDITENHKAEIFHAIIRENLPRKTDK